MSKSNWFGDDDQKGNFSNDKQDTFDPKKTYVGIRLQQGVPLLDRDWNELEDIRRYQEQMLRKWYIGDGIPDDDGFKIMPLDEPGNDFKIKAGRCLVDGFEAVNDHKDGFILYSAQGDGDADSEKISDLTNFKAFLDVWIEEVNKDGDLALANDEDVDMETCVRHQLKWRVRVRSGSGTFALEDRHHYYDLAKIERDKKTDPIEEEHITDLRRVGLALHRLRDTLTTNQIADDLHRHSKLVARVGSQDPALSVDNSGNVGIRTTTPAGRLQIIDVPQGAAGNILILGPTNASNLRLGYHEDYSWIQSHGSKPLAINPIGNNVGIGTTDPKAKLDVRGDIALGLTDGGGPKLLLTNAPHTHYIRANNWWTEFVSHPNEGWKFISRDADEKELERVRITSSGSVAIGTTAPSRALHVEDEIHSGGSRGGFSFADKTIKKFVEGPTNGERWVWHSAGGTARLWSGGDKLSVTRDGNVGVGTANPTGKLTIGGVSTGQTGFEVLGDVGNSHIPYLDGQVYLTGDISKDAKGAGSFIFRDYDGKDYFNRFVIDGKTGNATVYHAAQKEAKSGDVVGLKLQSPDGGGVIYGKDINHSIFFRIGRDGKDNVTDYHQYGTHRFFTDGSIENQKERMRIDQNGNVGIGTTIPSRTLHIEGSEIHSGGSGGGFSFADRDKKDFVEGPTKGERWVWHSAGGIARLWSGDDKLSVDKDGNLTTKGAIRGTLEGTLKGNIRIKDTRDDNDLPSKFNQEVSFDFKSRGSVDVPGAGTYSGMITLAPWVADGSGGFHHQLNFNNGGIFWRTGETGKMITFSTGTVVRRDTIDRPVARPADEIQPIVGIPGPVIGIPLTTSSWGSWQKIKTEDTSDERFKAGIAPLTNVLDKLSKVRGISFEWNNLYESLGYPSNGGRREIGLIAQEVEAVFPELVTSHGSENYRVLNYEKLTAVLVEAVKELRLEVEALKRNITS